MNQMNVNIFGPGIFDRFDRMFYCNCNNQLIHVNAPYSGVVQSFTMAAVTVVY